MTKSYYEAHVTILADPDIAKPIIESLKWKFSAIDGDINFGDGVKCYATRQFNAKISQEEMVKTLHNVADEIEANGLNVIRRKVELVIYDDRSSLVRPCSGGCIECHIDDYEERDMHRKNAPFASDSLK